jgi:hypothetical protein
MEFDAAPTHADGAADRASRSIAPRRRIGRWPCALSMRRGEIRIRAVWRVGISSVEKVQGVEIVGV